jgi:hypothetical protein
MPIDDKRRVHFTTTLFALIRESLEIKMRTGAKHHERMQVNHVRSFQL